MTDGSADEVTGCIEAASQLATKAKPLGITLSPSQIQTFATYCAVLLETNPHMNLTAAREPAAIARTLFLDSLTLIPAIPQEMRHSSARLVDVGSGAGVPGVPLKVVFPAWKLTLIESIGKKARFLERLPEALILDDVQVLAERAEIIGSGQIRDSADICTARAVAALPTLVELCAPLVRPGGLLVLPKSGDVDREIGNAAAAMRALRVSPRCMVPVASEIGLGEGRCVVVLQKDGPTPSGFPRRVGLARSQPIGSAPARVGRPRGRGERSG